MPALSALERDWLLRRARLSAAAALGGHALLPEKPPTPRLSEPAGCFVTFKRRGLPPGEGLRGCLGTLADKEALWKNVERLAADTVTGDARFADQPVTLAELPALHIDISVLHPERELAAPLDFTLGVDGISVYGRGPHLGRRGVYLPQVATEFGLSKEGFLSSCCNHKAGLPEDAWRDPTLCEVRAFEAEVIAEPE